MSDADRLPPEHEAVTDGDSRFFKRHAHRAHRVRLMAPVEMAVAAECGQTFAPLAPGARWYIAVRQIAPGYRLRAFFQAVGEVDTDQPEECCRLIYEASCGQAGRKMEDAFSRAIAETRGRA